MPVSNPAWLVMNGNNRFVVHWTMVKMLVAVDVSANRGTVNVLEDVRSGSSRMNAPELELGAKLRFTVAVPGGGVLVAGLALYRIHTAKSKFSLVAGLVLMTSQIAAGGPATSL